jgi:hypothetical protein
MAGMEQACPGGFGHVAYLALGFSVLVVRVDSTVAYCLHFV